MIKISNNIDVKQIIEITDKETGEINYLTMVDDEWVYITKERYEEIMRNKNDK